MFSGEKLIRISSSGGPPEKGASHEQEINGADSLPCDLKGPDPMVHLLMELLTGILSPDFHQTVNENLVLRGNYD